jgi:predicted Fe-S protein YdhL (DUF1289 family)
MIKPGADGRVASPCISVCRMEEASGLCVGCLRTLSEIATWGEMRDDERRDVWARLAQRATNVMTGTSNADR